jgi:hypothetical protein
MMIHRVDTAYKALAKTKLESRRDVSRRQARVVAQGKKRYSKNAGGRVGDAAVV